MLVRRRRESTILKNLVNTVSKHSFKSRKWSSQLQPSGGTRFYSQHYFVQEKINQLFSERLSNLTYATNSSKIDENFLIIDDPDITMRHRLIDIDIRAEAQNIINSPSRPGSRFKQVFALVTGMGRGKTRLLTELDIELKKLNGVHSVAITFNHLWDTSNIPASAIKDTRLLYAAAIISRIISIHYRIDFDDASRLAEELILEGGSQAKFKAEDLIGGCVRFVVEQMRRDKLDINHFILLVDESLKIEEKLNFPDIHHILRKALLDSPLSPDERPLAVDVVMSALNVKSTGMSDLGRRIVSITTPTQLNSRAVLRDWIKKHVPDLTFQSARDELKMLSLIECLSPVPRALQLMTTVLGSMKDHTTFDAAKMKQLYLGTMTDFNIQYPGTRHVPAQYGKALLFGKNIALDDTVMYLIKDSVFVNSLKSLSPSMTVCPETSIVSMQRLDTEIDDSEYLRVIVDTIESLLDNLMNSTGIEDAGKPLEIIMRGLIDARLQVLVDLDAAQLTGQKFSLSSLLQIHNIDAIKASNRMMNLLVIPNFVVNSGHKASGVVPRSNNFRGKAPTFSYVVRDFLTAANSASLEPGDPYMKINVDPKECVDGMWILRRGSDPFVLAVDCKSRQVGKPVRKSKAKLSSVFDKLPGLGLQAQHFLNMTKEAQAWPGNEVQDGSILDALRRGNFLYVYLSTQADSTVAVGDHILQMGRVDSERFLSFFKSYYMLHRASSGSADAEAARDKKARVSTTRNKVSKKVNSETD